MSKIKFILFVLILALFGCNKTPDVQPEKEVASPAPAPEPKLTPVQEAVINLAQTKSLEKAVGISTPFMEDTHNDYSMGTILFATWASEFLMWDMLEKIPDNKRVEIMKDPQAFRGMKLCSRGSIVQIRADRSFGKVVYDGILSVGWGGYISFIATGSTAGINENTGGVNFCGIVSGARSYNNSGGGTTHSLAVVGMFDIQENNPNYKNYQSY